MGHCPQSRHGPVQIENGIAYVFDSWSDGGGINHDITIPNQTTSLSFTANFVPAVFGTFATSPAGLKLSVDGGFNFPESGFAWKPGTTHRISAPPTQTDARGSKYRFVSWSNGKPATFDHVVGQTDERFMATYQPVAEATLASVPAGLQLDVDGTSCTTPCTIEKDSGAAIKVSTPAVRELSDDARLVFQGWGDTVDTARVITLSGPARTYTAAYTRQNRLLLEATPAEGASFTVTPSSADGFDDDGSLVSIAVKLGFGFRIMGWTGDIPGRPPRRR